MKITLRTSQVRAVAALLAIILAVPVSWKALTGFYIWLSPFIMLNSVLALRSFVWLNLFAIIILLVVIFRRRWFCNHLCPVGWSCDIVSGFNTKRKFRYSNIPPVDKWLAIVSLTAAIAGFPLLVIFDPVAIFNGFFSILSGSHTLSVILYLSALPVLLLINFFLPGIWCRKLCPLGGLQSVVYELRSWISGLFSARKPESVPANNGRRYFILTGTGLLAGMLTPGLLRPGARKVIRPPAAIEPVLYNTLCCRCGNCAKACPTGIIVPNTDVESIISWMTPKITFDKGYCLETCNLCSQVCPTGAITLFSVEAKSLIFMGSALITLDNCLLLNNKECIRCRESCKYEAVKFESDGNILKVVPVIVASKCVGCGACKVVCPADCIEVLALHNN